MYSIVIADDEKGICEGLCSIITNSLPECNIIKIFHDGTLLYDYLLSNQPDILLLDIEMPGRSGLDTARFLHEKSLDTHIIMITAHSKFEYARDAVNYHVENFITKPFSSEELIQILQKTMLSIARKRSTADNLLNVRRSLVCNLLNHAGALPSNGELLFCRGTAPLDELQCTETAFSSIESLSLPPDKMKLMRKKLIDCAEEDSFTQSTFLIEAENDHIIFLTFHRDAPKLCFISGIEKILSACANTMAQHTEKTYASFDLYRMVRFFSREMDAFWSNITSEGLPQAKVRLAAYLHSLSDKHLRHFVRYLSGNYQVKIESFDPDAILLSLDSLIDQAINIQSGMPIVKAAQEYILLNYASDSLSRSVVADHLGISDAHLSRLFSKHLGQTFSEYLLNVRMSRAKQLLKTTDLSTVLIAKSVGYYNPEYFRTTFKAYCGMTPRHFRLLQNGKE